MPIALTKGLRNIHTMTHKTHQQHTLAPHDALIRAAALTREETRHMQEKTVLESRINEINLRLAALQVEQNHLITSRAFKSHVIDRGSKADQGFKIKY